MKKLFYAIAVALTLTGFVACDDGPEVEPAVEPTGSGLNSQDFEKNIEVTYFGTTMNLTFDAKASWRLLPSKSWCTVDPISGSAGSNVVTLTVEENTGENRSASISITVSGYSSEVICTIEQAEKVETTSLNGVIHDTMSETYLWNEEYRQLDMSSLLNTASASAFLQAGLEGVDAMNHINIEDGGWVTNSQGITEREYFSYIRDVASSSNAPAKAMQTRAEVSGLGLTSVQPSYLDENTGARKVGLGVLGVYQGSPAAEAGITRGTYINRINGTTITETNFSTLVQRLNIASGSLRLGTAVLSVVGSVLNIDENGPEYELTAGLYNESSILYAGIVTLGNANNTKVGYLAYGSFDNTYDQTLITLFDAFNEQNIDELIIDLRYNGGGHVMSSTLLATLIAGNEYRDQIYTRLEYNRERTDNGEEGFFRIGNSITPDGAYSLIADATQHALNFKRVYVIGTVDTASASEMLINGLRGLDIDVRLIGQQTHGKNVGMEGWRRNMGTYYVEFAPITFRAYNAKSECNYADGFVPDVITLKENEAAVFGYGHEQEALGRYALLWISTGEKPANATSLVMAAPGTGLRLESAAQVDLSKNPQMKGALVYRGEM